MKRSEPCKKKWKCVQREGREAGSNQQKQGPQSRLGEGTGKGVGGYSQGPRISNGQVMYCPIGQNEKPGQAPRRTGGQ